MTESAKPNIQLTGEGLEQFLSDDAWEQDRALLRFADGCVSAARHNPLMNLELYVFGTPARPERLQLVYLLGGYSQADETNEFACQLMSDFTGEEYERFVKWSKTAADEFMMAVPLHNLRDDLLIEGDGIQQFKYCGEYKVFCTIAMRRSKMTLAFTVELD